MVAESNVTYTDGSVSIPVTTILLLVGSFVFILGIYWARTKRARSDYKSIKAALGPARKAHRGLLWKTIKYGTLVFVIGCLLIAWVGHDVRTGTSKPVPAEVAPTPSKPRR